LHDFGRTTMYFLDCFIQTIQTGKKRIRMKPLEGQNVPDLFVECSRPERLKYPIGTIFKADLKIIQVNNKKPYLITRHRKLERAIEYFEHNRQLKKQE